EQAAARAHGAASAHTHPPGASTYKYTAFFFPRRRRHTTLVSDWSSDVGCSDLRAAMVGELFEARRLLEPAIAALAARRATRDEKIGRASCRERWSTRAVAASRRLKIAKTSTTDIKISAFSDRSGTGTQEGTTYR